MNLLITCMINRCTRTSITFTSRAHSPGSIQKLSLDVHTSLVEKKLSLSLPSTENSSGSKRGNHGQQMR